jgi:chemotaxis protein CheD
MITTLTPRSGSAIVVSSASGSRASAERPAVLPQMYLHPGQMHATTDGCAMTTVLGSCVAVCLYDNRRKIGGMNHFLLPNHSKERDDAGRYGPSATQELLDRMFALGASAETMTARLVGGANVLSAVATITPPLGLRNVQVAQEVLTAAGVLVIARDVGGDRGRKLVFSPRDGTTWIQFLGR